MTEHRSALRPQMQPQSSEVSNSDLSIWLSGDSDTRQAAEMLVLQKARRCLVLRDGFLVGQDAPDRGSPLGSGGLDASLQPDSYSGWDLCRHFKNTNPDN